MPRPKPPPKDRLIKRYTARIKNLQGRLERFDAEAKEQRQEIVDRIEENQEMLEALS